MLKGMKDLKGKSYEERLQKLNLWSLEERRNRQDLTEVFKICKGLSRIRPEELFHFDSRGKGTSYKKVEPVGPGVSRCDQHQRI